MGLFSWIFGSKKFKNELEKEGMKLLAQMINRLRAEGKTDREIMDARNRFMAKLNEYMKQNEPDGILTDQEKKDIEYLAKDSLLLGNGVVNLFNRK